MNKVICDICDKVFKSKGGLTRHKKTCSKPEEVEVIESMPESIEEPSEANIELNRRIDKLRVTISQCYDAETKYRLECELKSLTK